MTYIVDFEPIGRRVETETGETLLVAAQRGGVGLAAVCGGAGTCGRCLVQVMSGPVSPPTEDERKRIRGEQIEKGYRLACQARVLGDCKINVPPGSLTAAQRTQVEGRVSDVLVDPIVRGTTVQLSPAVREDLRSDATRLRDELSSRGVPCERVDLAAAQRLQVDSYRCQESFCNGVLCSG